MFGTMASEQPRLRAAGPKSRLQRDVKAPQTAQSRPVISRLENRLKYAFVIASLRLMGNTGLARPFTMYFMSLRRFHRAWRPESHPEAKYVAAVARHDTEAQLEVVGSHDSSNPAENKRSRAHAQRKCSGAAPLRRHIVVRVLRRTGRDAFSRPQPSASGARRASQRGRFERRIRSRCKRCREV
jgi:hypothetical protein